MMFPSIALGHQSEFFTQLVALAAVQLGWILIVYSIPFCGGPNGLVVPFDDSVDGNGNT